MEANDADMWENNSGSDENGVQETECEMEISPNGAKQWIPTANPEETPYRGQKFKTVDEGIEFYKAYAKAVGFDVRHGTMRKTRGGEVAIKYMVCSREGFKPAAKEKNSQKDNEAQSLANQLWNEFYNCMGLVNGWQEKMNEMLTTLQQLKKEFHKSKLQTNQSPAAESAIEAIVGSRTTGEIRIKPPKFAHNKGSGKRLKSNKEKDIEKSKKKSRTCATCGGKGHNNRTCIENRTDFSD
nr:protein FAR1-RELATED SEQUENCE 5-like [Ipomoea batatas]